MGTNFKLFAINYSGNYIVSR